MSPKFTFKIVCGHDISQPYENALEVFQDLNTLGELVLSEYKYLGGNCEITEYILDNDDDRTNLYVPIAGVSGLPATAPCGETLLNCRKVLFDTSAIMIYHFYIHVKGMAPPGDVDFTMTPKISISIGCNS